MVYREGTPADYPAITELISTGDYYLPTNAAEIGGQWIVAEHDGQIIGTIWAFAAGPQAYVDYWYVRPEWRHGMVPAKLVMLMQAALQNHGVRFVRACILTNNQSAKRLLAALDMAVDDGYSMAYKEL
jgi:RimJ/RimL family protein N-acetyltransferase